MNDNQRVTQGVTLYDDLDPYLSNIDDLDPLDLLPTPLPSPPMMMAQPNPLHPLDETGPRRRAPEPHLASSLHSEPDTGLSLATKITSFLSLKDAPSLAALFYDKGPSIVSTTSRTTMQGATANAPTQAPYTSSATSTPNALSQSMTAFFLGANAGGGTHGGTSTTRDEPGTPTESEPPLRYA